MLACPNENFIIKYIVSFSCIVFFFMDLLCILCLILQVRKISHPPMGSFPAYIELCRVSLE